MTPTNCPRCGAIEDELYRAPGFPVRTVYTCGTAHWKETAIRPELATTSTALAFELDGFRKRVAELEAERTAERLAWALMCQGIEQTAGKALSYPRYCDDQANFPGTTPNDGVCVGEHTAETIVMELAREVDHLKAELSKAQDQIRDMSIL